MKTSLSKNLLWAPFAFLAIRWGLYPLSFSSSDFREHSFLAVKPEEIRTSTAYLTCLYIHITFGGIALLTGWSQFIKPWRRSHLSIHRFIGYINVISVLIGSIMGFIISFFSNGGTITALGFGLLGVLWFRSNLNAFLNIKQGKIKEHEKWMMRTYALTFSAATFRVYNPIFLANGFDYVLVEQINSWICWVPNAIVIELFIRSRRSGKERKPMVKSEQKDELLGRQ